MTSESERRLGALFIDLENLYQSIRREYSGATELTSVVIQAIREHLKNKMNIFIVEGRAYAPFEYDPSRLFMTDLELLGITPVNVLAKESKNSADLMLSIECIEILLQRKDISSFIIVGGDRDYIPVARRIQREARNILVISPIESMSGDLLTIIDKENHLDPLSLVSPKVLEQKSKKAPVDPPRSSEERPVSKTEPRVEKTVVPAAKPNPPKPAEAVASREAPQVPATLAEFEKSIDDTHELEDIRAITKLILNFRKDRRIQEVWLGPFFRSLNDAFPLKSHAQRKELINRLRDLGVVFIEERPRSDEDSTYAVLIVNWEHPLVVELNPG